MHGIASHGGMYDSFGAHLYDLVGGTAIYSRKSPVRPCISRRPGPNGASLDDETGPTLPGPRHLVHRVMTANA